MRGCLSACLACCLILSLPQVQADERPLKLSNATLPPVTTSSGDGFLNGIASEMFDRAGLQFELVTLPPARALAQSNAGLLDGELARISVPEDRYPNLLKLSEPLIDVVFAGVHLQDELTVEAPDDFRPFRVGYIRGWVIAENLFSEHPSATATDSVDQLLDMLAAERIDIAFLTIAPARHLASLRGMNELKSTGFRQSKDLFLYLHKRHADQLPLLARALRSMKQDGTHAAILRQYQLMNR